MSEPQPASGAADASQSLLVERVRSGDERAWEQLIATYEGRLQAFVRSRVGDAALVEDVVQETFLGLLTSLPNYDARTPLETFLFAIAAHKSVDALRRSGRRPEITSPTGESGSLRELTGLRRRVSSLVRSREGHRSDADILSDALREFLLVCRQEGWWERIACLELLWVRGLSNQRVARELEISEQSVANHKSFATRKLMQVVPERLRDRLPEADLTDGR